MARQLFGTDGIRGKAGEPPLDRPTAYALGVALGEWARGRSETPKILIGMDTRESGPWLAEAVAAGLVAAEVEPHFADLLTTPGVAWNTKNNPYVTGVMISASHNPFEDNGLKVFDHSNFKLPDEQELQLETRILAVRENAVVPPCPLTLHEDLAGRYLDFLAATFSHSLKGLRIVADCANGAASHLAPALLSRLGAEVIAIGNAPDGRNINLGVGALHLEHLRQAVLEHQAAFGVAFDGDADRSLYVSASGKLIDGDAVLLICALRMRELGKLPNNRVVATVMSNLGLEVALRRHGITLDRTAVGDKYVLEEMLNTNSTIGGEQSGHVIFSEFATTGDGMLTSLRVLDAMLSSGRSLDQLTEEFTVFPQLLVNVRIAERTPLENLPEVQQAIGECEREFHGNGRVLVRFSGTEPLARVMVEGDDLAKVNHHAHRIADTLQASIGIK